MNGAGLASRHPRQARLRAIVKTVLYRVVMVLVTVSIALLVTGNAGEALSIGLATNVLKTGTYYAYERVWDRIEWGVSRSRSESR
ncbi:DUF2061 domain-containing protein [Natronococcus sp. JC468]|uniref:DUF2061 domain-containing protein n=1 Tax=Natronococcus sp. JC468 TaxID=1961921 RepID=UPI0014387349|nr:DUF2061 domain-containing protein [Natronococcus sp. JC468]NKE36926.1 DUF2061 domain-containing protein [Natronococcus sp. JC468]